jgi:hypothetical protein
VKCRDFNGGTGGICNHHCFKAPHLVLAFGSLTEDLIRIKYKNPRARQWMTGAVFISPQTLCESSKYKVTVDCR